MRYLFMVCVSLLLQAGTPIRIKRKFDASQISGQESKKMHVGNLDTKIQKESESKEAEEKIDAGVDRRPTGKSKANGEATPEQQVADLEACIAYLKARMTLTEPFRYALDSFLALFRRVAPQPSVTKPTAPPTTETLYVGTFNALEMKKTYPDIASFAIVTQETLKVKFEGWAKGVIERLFAEESSEILTGLQIPAGESLSLLAVQEYDVDNLETTKPKNVDCKTVNPRRSTYIRMDAEDRKAKTWQPFFKLFEQAVGDVRADQWPVKVEGEFADSSPSYLCWKTSKITNVERRSASSEECDESAKQKKKDTPGCGSMGLFEVTTRKGNSFKVFAGHAPATGLKEKVIPAGAPAPDMLLMDSNCKKDRKGCTVLENYRVNGNGGGPLATTCKTVSKLRKPAQTWMGSKAWSFKELAEELSEGAVITCQRLLSKEECGCKDEDDVIDSKCLRPGAPAKKHGESPKCKYLWRLCNIYKEVEGGVTPNTDYIEYFPFDLQAFVFEMNDVEEGPPAYKHFHEKLKTYDFVRNFESHALPFYDKLETLCEKEDIVAIHMDAAHLTFSGSGARTHPSEDPANLSEEYPRAAWASDHFVVASAVNVKAKQRP